MSRFLFLRLVLWEYPLLLWYGGQQEVYLRPNVSCLKVESRVVVGLVYITKYTIGKIALGLDYFERRISCLESNGYTFRIDGGSMGIPQMVL